MKKIIKIFGFFMATLFCLIIITISVFLMFSPQVGGKATQEQKIEYAKSEHYKNGMFINQTPTIMNISYWSIFKKLFKKSPNRKPIKDISVKKIDSIAIEYHNANITQLTWFGHSTFLLEMEGQKILIDPMLGKRASPFSFIGPKRYSKELPIKIKKLPFIDAVILSHDHYDHLDYGSIQELKGKVGHYFTPLGVGNHLVGWGIEKEKISELNWWESSTLDSLKLICTPARHFSGRGLFDRSTTLWCSWVIKGQKDNIFFSGDGGYDTHFKKIGKQYGPFNIALIECGQYNKNWKAIHMMPEETIQASIDLNSKLVFPIHWGAFTLALHDWTEPIERITKRANELNIPIITPKIGEPIILPYPLSPTEKWWLNYHSEH